MDATKKIDELKSALGDITFSQDMDEDVLAILERKAELVRETLNDMGFILQKAETDEEEVSGIKAELLKDIQANPLYNDIPSYKIDQIIRSIVRKPDKHVLSQEEFDDEVLVILRKLSDDGLIDVAYSKADIEQVGFGITRSHGPQAMTRGREALNQIVKTPIGRQEALTKAIETIKANRDLSLYYLYKYYDVGAEESKPEEA